MAKGWYYGRGGRVFPSLVPLFLVFALVASAHDVVHKNAETSHHGQEDDSRRQDANGITGVVDFERGITVSPQRRNAGEVGKAEVFRKLLNPSRANGGVAVPQVADQDTQTFSHHHMTSKYGGTHASDKVLYEPKEREVELYRVTENHGHTNRETGGQHHDSHEDRETADSFAVSPSSSKNRDKLFTKIISDAAEARRLAKNHRNDFDLIVATDESKISITNEDLIGIYSIYDFNQRSNFVRQLINRYSVMRENYIAKQLSYLDVSYRPPLITGQSIGALMEATQGFVGGVARIEIKKASIRGMLASYEGPSVEFAWGLQRALKDTAISVMGEGESSDGQRGIDGSDGFAALVLHDGYTVQLTDAKVFPSETHNFFRKAEGLVKSNLPEDARRIKVEGLSDRCVAPNLEFVGNDVVKYDNGEITSPEMCNKKCITLEQCSYWTFVSTKNCCHLKNKNAIGTMRFTPVHHRESFISGTKGCESALYDSDRLLTIDYMIVRPYDRHNSENIHHEKERIKVIMQHLSKQFKNKESYFHRKTFFGKRLHKFMENVEIQHRIIGLIDEKKAFGYAPYADLIGEALPEVAQANFDYYGYDLWKDETGRIKNWSECRHQCKENISCTHWTFWNPLRWCYLKAEFYSEQHFCEIERKKHEPGRHGASEPQADDFPQYCHWGYIRVPRSLQLISGAIKWEKMRNGILGTTTTTTFTTRAITTTTTPATTIATTTSASSTK